MTTARRTLCVLLMASALLGACGDDEEDPPTTIPTSGPTTGPRAPTTTVPATIVQNATDGAVCSPAGVRGRTAQGIPLVCVQIAGGNETRWRPE
jgi:hypothetical protein